MTSRVEPGAVSPAGMAAYAGRLGWKAGELYRGRSRIHTGAGLPEIVIPITTELGDYGAVVQRLIQVFAATTGRDELSVYRDLVRQSRLQEAMADWRRLKGVWGVRPTLLIAAHRRVLALRQALGSRGHGSAGSSRRDG